MEIRQVQPKKQIQEKIQNSEIPQTVLDEKGQIELYEPSERESGYFEKFLTSENYQNFMLDLELGASLSGVCAKFGLGSHTVKKWFNCKGEGFDKFRKDFLISIGDAYVLAEQALHQKNPQYYLTRGAGKYVPDNIHLEPEVENTRIESKEGDEFKTINSDQSKRVSDLAQQYLSNTGENGVKTPAGDS